MSTNDTTTNTTITDRTFQQEALNGLTVCIRDAERAMWGILTRLTSHAYGPGEQLDDVEQAAAIARNIRVLEGASRIVNQAYHGDGYGDRDYVAPVTHDPND